MIMLFSICDFFKPKAKNKLFYERTDCERPILHIHPYSRFEEKFFQFSDHFATKQLFLLSYS